LDVAEIENSDNNTNNDKNDKKLERKVELRNQLKEEIRELRKSQQVVENNFKEIKEKQLKLE
jgi:hypothetical protein